MCSSMALRGGGASPARCVATTSPSTSEKHHPGLDPASAHAAAAGKWRKLRSGGFAVLHDKCSNLPALMFFPIRDLFTLPSTSTLLDRSIEPQSPS